MDGDGRLCRPDLCVYTERTWLRYYPWCRNTMKTAAKFYSFSDCTFFCNTTTTVQQTRLPAIFVKMVLGIFWIRGTRAINKNTLITFRYAWDWPQPRTYILSLFDCDTFERWAKLSVNFSNVRYEIDRKASCYQVEVGEYLHIICANDDATHVQKIVRKRTNRKIPHSVAHLR